ncbi:winged helix-turn-helix transcriptional regulator [Mycobacterium sp. NPDC003449]
MLGLLGDEWTLLITQQALLGATRYAEFAARLPISNSVLTRRLNAMTDDGLLVRFRYQDKPPRDEYLATARARALWPVLVSIWEWERRWVPEHTATLPAMHHTACGNEFSPTFTCRACGRIADAKTLTAQWGPSGSWPRSMAGQSTRRRTHTDRATGGPDLFPQTMSILGNRWAFAVLVAAFVGTDRFTDFAGQLGAPPGTLSDRLRIFTANGVLDSTDGRYRLTGKGRAVLPILVTALGWAQHWFRSPEGPAVLLTHRPCGAAFEAVLACDRCERPLSGTTVSAVQPKPQVVAGRGPLDVED